MKTIRRLYFYAVSMIGIEVAVWGIINLLRSMLGYEIADSASALAGALSLIFVGMTAFLIHWLWAQSVSAKEEEEQTASLRAVFLYGVLLGTLIPVAQNLLALINRAFLSTANLYTSRAVFGGTQTWMDNLIAIVINLLIAAYFWNVLQGGWKTLPEKENFTEVRRLARFIWMLYGLLFTVYGAQQALSYAFTFSTQNILGGIGRETVVNALALLLIGSPIWFFAWKLLQDALEDSSERESLLRLGILYLLSLGGVIAILTAGGNLLYIVLMQILGEGKKAAEFIQDIGVPISIGIPLGVVWAYYGAWLNRQFYFDEDAPRRASKKRLYFYILSLLGLAASTFALASLFSLVIDLLTAQRYLNAGGFADPLARALSYLAAGLPLWLLTWRPMQGHALEESAMGDHARRSVIRKTYLYLVLFAAVIGVMVSAGGLIFNLINAALGGGEEDLLNTVLNTLQALVIFTVLLLYHLSALQKDAKFHANELALNQKEFRVAVLDHDGKFGAAAKTAFTKLAPELTLHLVEATSLPVELQADALIFSSALLLGEANPLGALVRSFGGIKISVEENAAGVLWAPSLSQAVEFSRVISEGGQARPQSSRPASAWMVAVYIFAGLFALQFLFLLMMFAVSLVTGF